MSQPLNFVAADLDMMMPGGTPMITSSSHNPYNTGMGGMGGMGGFQSGVPGSGPGFF
jgi:hypothetical protein